MSSKQREREKWRNKRRQIREGNRAFSASRPALRPDADRIRHKRAEWDEIPQQVYRRNNAAVDPIEGIP
ncbi:hypothetical protein [Streptomyces rimosus]|uniref:hypothetical protein n=1 Tax=Streptomyces rimosus TaxID=1927 RepID=UPI00131A77E8|nr:hypothetical protein [Streptomyces rimosus]